MNIKFTIKKILFLSIVFFSAWLAAEQPAEIDFVDKSKAAGVTVEAVDENTAVNKNQSNTQKPVAKPQSREKQTLDNKAKAKKEGTTTAQKSQPRKRAKIYRYYEFLEVKVVNNGGYWAYFKVCETCKLRKKKITEDTEILDASGSGQASNLDVTKLVSGRQYLVSLGFYKSDNDLDEFVIMKDK